MKAFIITGNHSSDLNPLDKDFAGCMSPLLDRPWLQHFIEVLVNKGIKKFHIFISDHPGQIESYFEDGIRWGANFTYHIGADEATLFRQIKIQSSLMQNEKILLCQANCMFFTVPDFKDSTDKNCLKISEEKEEKPANSWFMVDAEILSKLPKETSFNTIETAIFAQVPAEKRHYFKTSESLRLNSLKDLLDAQNQLMQNRFPQLMCNANEIESGIRVSRNVVLSPRAKIVPPVFIGENSQISDKVTVGPNASISANCIIDTGSSIVNSAVFPGSYVGESLNVSNSIINHNQLINLDIGGEVLLSEDFLLGSLSEKWLTNYVVDLVWRLTAACLFMAFLPALIFVTLFLLFIKGKKNLFREKICLRTPAKSINEINTFSYFSFSDRTPGIRKNPYHPMAHFLLDFLPGLISVIKGDIALVGLPLKTKQEFKTLSDQQKKLFLLRKCGLVNESQVFWQSCGDPEELQMAATYYMAKKSFLFDLKLLTKYFLSIFTLPK